MKCSVWKKWPTCLARGNQVWPRNHIMWLPPCLVFEGQTPGSDSLDPPKSEGECKKVRKTSRASRRTQLPPAAPFEFEARETGEMQKGEMAPAPRTPRSVT